MDHNISPLPWVVFGRDIEDGGEDHIVTTYSLSTANPAKGEANAAFIVKAVNSHDQLVAALRGIVFCDWAHLIPSEFLDPARAALSNAEVQP